MRRLMQLFALTLALFLAPMPALATTRALLTACSDFLTQPDLGSAISGNLHLIGSALVSADVRPGDLSIEDGTIGTVDALSTALQDAFGQADENDLSILYLCTHGVLSSADDEQVYLLLGDGVSESPLGAQQLYDLVKDIQGEKLLIVDACFSGALIGRGHPQVGALPGSMLHEPGKAAPLSPFLADPSIHVLTSASGHESSWYYDSERLSTGAVSYFASALASGLGLYGAAEADLDGDGSVTLSELHRYLNVAVPSSSSQLLSVRAEQLTLPVARGAMLSRPLSGFSYGASLLTADDPVLDFSFTVTREGVGVQYRLIDFADGAWNWEEAKTFRDSGEQPDGTLGVGRKTRSLTLENLLSEDSGYLMLQIFSVSGSGVALCSERLIAVQPAAGESVLSLSCRGALEHPGYQELPIDVRAGVPAELTVCVFDAEGALVRRLASSQLTRPTPGGVAHLYWDGRDAQGVPVEPGTYTVTAEARIGGVRQKAAADVTVGP